MTSDFIASNVHETDHILSPSSSMKLGIALFRHLGKKSIPQPGVNLKKLVYHLHRSVILFVDNRFRFNVCEVLCSFRKFDS